MDIFVASAFSKNTTGGNKAGVCLMKEYLSTEQKQKISAKLGYTETTFVSPSHKKEATFQLEYFTPVAEVALCGHATIAAFVVMKAMNLLKENTYKIETKSGMLSVYLEDDKIFMEQKLPQFGNIINHEVFINCFDIPITSNNLPVQIVSTGLKDIMLPIQNINTLLTMKPDFEEIKRISKKYNTIGIHAFVIQGNKIICRNFAPLYDVPEESATGTANGALACYLYQNNVMKQTRYTFEQGYSLGEPSEIIVKLIVQDNAIEKVIVGGRGYLITKKNIES